MPYKHGVYISEVPTSILPPVRVESAMPVVFGTAPVHLRSAADGGPVNEPVLVNTYAEAVAAVGYSDDWEGYTLCEFVKSYFGLFNVAPVVLVNVFDPATHNTDVIEEAVTLDADGVGALDHAGLVADPVVENAAGSVTYVKDTDYTVDRAAGSITRIAAGAIAAGASLLVTYSYAAPSQVTSSLIVGGIDAVTGQATGLELVDSVFPRFRLVPGQIVAPGWSKVPAVAQVMAAKAADINGHFRAIAVIDIDDALVTKYQDVPGYKNDNNLTDPRMVVCWPRIALDGVTYHLSSQLAGLIARVDGEHDGVPYKSPSNETLRMTSMVADGQSVWLGPEQANYLNGQGIVTALNFVGGWKSWGNRTAAYPAVTDVKDSTIALRRMYDWIGNTVVLTWWQKIDYPITRRLVETIIDSVNIWLNSLAAREIILGGRVAFLAEENPYTDIMDSIVRFHVYITPPSPAEQIDFILEYDPSYLETLFSA